MKLNIRINNSIPRTEKIKLTSELVELLDSYVHFYQTEFSASITADKAIVEMLSAFIKSDRNFMRWYRSKNNKPE
jgi:hypothetical protein